MVTAKHVAEFLDPNSEVTINLSSGKSTNIKFTLLTQTPLIRGAKWFRHRAADIAIHPIAYPRDAKHSAFPSTDLSEVDPATPLLSTVWVLGFPLGLGTDGTLNPIAKKAQVASQVMHLPGFDPTLKFILLDEALAQGYSGAPVIWIEDVFSSIKVGAQPIKAGERAHLIGIQVSALSDITGGKISVIVPISYLIDIFRSADFAAYEKQISDPNRPS